MDFQDTEIIAISKSEVTEVNQFDFLPALFGKGGFKSEVQHPWIQ